MHTVGVTLAQLAPQGETDAGRFEARRCHLIEQRREAVVVVAVDKRDIKPAYIYMLYEIQTGESSAYHHHFLQLLTAFHLMNIKITQIIYF